MRCSIRHDAGIAGGERRTRLVHVMLKQESFLAYPYVVDVGVLNGLSLYC